MGNVTSQLEAPFSLPRSMALCNFGGRTSCSLDASPASSLLLSVFTRCLMTNCSELMSCENAFSCLRMAVVRGAAIRLELQWWMVALLVGFIMPKPPRQAGSSRRFLSMSLSPVRPVSAGRKLCLIASSTG